MSRSELDLFVVFDPEDWDAFSSRLVEISLRYRGQRSRASFDLFWMEVEELVRELASKRLESQGQELIALAAAKALLN